MTGFELQTSGIGSNRSTNWATTTAHRMYFKTCRLNEVVDFLLGRRQSIVLGDGNEHNSIILWNDNTRSWHLNDVFNISKMIDLQRSRFYTKIIEKLSGLGPASVMVSMCPLAFVSEEPSSNLAKFKSYVIQMAYSWPFFFSFFFFYSWQKIKPVNE